jgi:hypothetical protein
MNKHTFMVLIHIFFGLPTSSFADSQQLIEFPKMMQEHMLKSIRGHLPALAEIQRHLALTDWACLL